MPVRQVWGRVERPGGAAFPSVGARVVADLYAAGNVTYGESGDASVGTVATLTDSSGVWTFELEPNSNISPAGTVWRVSVTPVDGETSTSYFEVPDTAGPHNVADILSDAPSSVGSIPLNEHAALTALEAHGAQRAFVADVRDYGATVYASAEAVVTASSAAVQAAVDACATAGGGVVLVPGWVGIDSAIVHKRNVIIRGVGMFASGLYAMSDVTLLSRHSGTVSPGSFQGLEDLTLWGYGDRTQSLGSDSTRLANTSGSEHVWFHRVRGIHSRQMSLTGFGTLESEAVACVVERSRRDAINLTGGPRARITGNRVDRCGDDAIAFHLSSSTQSGSFSYMQSVITGNVVTRSFGIKSLGASNAVIANNVMRFVYGYGVYVGLDGSEGAADSLGVQVTDNSILDVIHSSLVAGSSIGAGIYVTPPAAAAASGPIPGLTGFGTGTESSIGRPVSNAWSASGTPYTGSYGVRVSGNVVMQTIDGVTTFSDVGAGDLWNNAGDLDPEMVSNIGTAGGASVYGIHLANGATRASIVSSNYLYGCSSAVKVTAITAGGNVRVNDNMVTRCNVGVDLVAASQVVGRFVVEGNEFDLDPLFESAERATSDGEFTGGWSVTTGVSATMLYTTNVVGVMSIRNVLSNAVSPSTGGGTVLFRDNVARADGAGAGVRFSSAAERMQFGEVAMIDADPRSATYGTLRTGGVRASSSQPGSGYYAAGAMVMNSAASPAAGVMTLGWYRLTTGSGHVAGTDWVPVKVTTT